jgi:hypothetical protein
MRGGILRECELVGAPRRETATGWRSPAVSRSSPCRIGQGRIRQEQVGHRNGEANSS